MECCEDIVRPWNNGKLKAKWGAFKRKKKRIVFDYQSDKESHGITFFVRDYLIEASKKLRR